MLWLYLYFPSLQLDAVLANLNEQEKDSALLAIVDECSNTLVQTSQAARKQGIKLDMGLASAAMMCPNLQILPYQASTHKQALTNLVQQLYGIASDIALDAPNGLYLRIGNMLNLYQGIANLWYALQSVLSLSKVNYHYATAYSSQAAKLLALNKSNLLSDEHEKIRQQLYALPIHTLTITSKQLQSLQRLGLKTLAQLFALPSKSLMQRFTPEFLYYLQQIQGRVAEKHQFYQPNPSFIHYWELLYEITNSQILHHPFKQLLARLSNFLLLRNLATQEISLTLHLREASDLTLNIASAKAMDNQTKWLQLAQLHFEKITLKAPVIAMTLSCSSLQNNQLTSHDLLSTKQGSHINSSELISLLQAKLGQTLVTGLKPAGDHQPESVLKPTTPLAIEKVMPKEHHLFRPSYLLDSPEPLSEKMHILHGPERIETHWWQAPLMRDYYIGRNEQGQWCWLFRQHDGSWFLHGYFA